jgi:hypothetical protein
MHLKAAVTGSNQHWFPEHTCLSPFELLFKLVGEFEPDIVPLLAKSDLEAVFLQSEITEMFFFVKDWKMIHTMNLEHKRFFSLKVLAHFRSKELVDFSTYDTQILCLTVVKVKYVLRNEYI